MSGNSESKLTKKTNVITMATIGVETEDLRERGMRYNNYKTNWGEYVMDRIEVRATIYDIYVELGEKWKTI